MVYPRISSTDVDVSCGTSVPQAHPPAPRQRRLPHPDERPQPATAPHQAWCFDGRGGHRRAACDDAAGQRRDRGATEPRGMSWFNGNGHFEKSAMMAEEVSDDGRETPDVYRRGDA